MGVLPVGGYLRSPSLALGWPGCGESHMQNEVGWQGVAAGLPPARWGSGGAGAVLEGAGG